MLAFSCLHETKRSRHDAGTVCALTQHAAIQESEMWSVAQQCLHQGNSDPMVTHGYKLSLSCDTLEKDKASWFPLLDGETEVQFPPPLPLLVVVCQNNILRYCLRTLTCLEVLKVFPKRAYVEEKHSFNEQLLFIAEESCRSLWHLKRIPNPVMNSWECLVCSLVFCSSVFMPHTSYMQTNCTGNTWNEISPLRILALFPLHRSIQLFTVLLCEFKWVMWVQGKLFSNPLSPAI